MSCSGIKIFSGTSNVPLAKKVASGLGVSLGKCSMGKFANGETSVVLGESVRNFDVYIIQSTSNPSPNDYLMELLILVDAVKRASPARITAVLPYFAYSRQDKKETGRAPITCKLVATMLSTAGVQRIITIDLHAAVTKGFWEIPVENISAEPLILKYIKRNILQHLDEDNVHFNEAHDMHWLSKEAQILRQKEESALKIVVSPDEGGAKRAKSVADKLGTEFAVIYHKKGPEDEDGGLVGSVEGKVAVVIDDMADTCTKLRRSTETLKKNGALDTYVVCTHGLFSDEAALQRVREAPIEAIVVTNTIAPTEAVKNIPKIKVLDVAPLLTEAIRRQHYGEIGAYELELKDAELW